MRTKHDAPCAGDGAGFLYKTPPRRRLSALFLFAFFFLPSCATPQTASPPQVVTAYATSAAIPWLTELYACAEESNAVIEISATSPDVFLRLGEPETLMTPAYQIGEEELLIIVNQESPAQNLTLEEVQAIFAGRGDLSAQVWVYASGEDLQILFDQVVMKGRAVSSFARVAVNPQKMLEAVSSEPNAIGILPRHSMKSGQAVRDAASLGMAPVLAITRTQADGIVKNLLACITR